jgi:hypothetical protein
MWLEATVSNGERFGFVGFISMFLRWSLAYLFTGLASNSWDQAVLPP